MGSLRPTALLLLLLQWQGLLLWLLRHGCKLLWLLLLLPLLCGHKDLLQLLHGHGGALLQLLQRQLGLHGHEERQVELLLELQVGAMGQRGWRQRLRLLQLLGQKGYARLLLAHLHLLRLLHHLQPPRVWLRADLQGPTHQGSEVWVLHRHGHRHVLLQRQPWHGRLLQLKPGRRLRLQQQLLLAQQLGQLPGLEGRLRLVLEVLRVLIRGPPAQVLQQLLLLLLQLQQRDPARPVVQLQVGCLLLLLMVVVVVVVSLELLLVRQRGLAPRGRGRVRRRQACRQLLLMMVVVVAAAMVGMRLELCLLRSTHTQRKWVQG